MPLFPVVALIAMPRAVIGPVSPWAMRTAAPPHPAEAADHPEQSEEQPEGRKSAEEPPMSRGLPSDGNGLALRAKAVGDDGHEHKHQRGDGPGNPRSAAVRSIWFVHCVVLSRDAASLA